MTGIINQTGNVQGMIATRASGGGGSATWEAVASGTIADGAKLILRSDGKVETAVQGADTPLDVVTSDDQKESLGVRVDETAAHMPSGAFNQNDYPMHKVWIDYDPLDANKFIVAYKNGSGGTLHVRIGTISGTAITFGTAVEVNSNADHCPPCVHFHPSTAGLFAVLYGTTSTNECRLHFGLVSGTTITLVSYKVLNSYSGSYGSRTGNVCFDWDKFSSTNHWACQVDSAETAYAGNNNGYKARRMASVFCGVVNSDATSPTESSKHYLNGGAPTECDETNWWYGGCQVRSLRFDPFNANKFLVTGLCNENPTQGAGTQTVPALYIVTTNGGTAFTSNTTNNDVGTQINMSTACGVTGYNEHHCEWNPGIENQLVFSSQQQFSGTTEDTDPVAIVGTVSNLTVTWGTKLQLTPSATQTFRTSFPWEIWFGTGASSGRFYGATSLWRATASYGGTSYIDIQSFDISGTGGSATIATGGSMVQFCDHNWLNTGGGTHIGVCHPWHVAVDPTGRKFMVSHLKGTSSSAEPTWFTSGSCGTEGATNVTAGNFIGIADGAYADGATVKVQLSSSSIDDSQSGLTTGSGYYLQRNGSLSTTPDTPSILAGIALSATELLIKG